MAVELTEEGSTYVCPSEVDLEKSTRCEKCGITLDDVMYYVCNKEDCPCFLKVKYS